MNSAGMHALLTRLGFADVLEFETPGYGATRSIFMAFKAGHRFAGFVAANADKRRPRVPFVPRQDPENLKLRDENRALKAALGAAERRRARTLRNLVGFLAKR
jgi:hypothetical protein